MLTSVLSRCEFVLSTVQADLKMFIDCIRCNAFCLSPKLISSARCYTNTSTYLLACVQPSQCIGKESSHLVEKCKVVIYCIRYNRDIIKKDKQNYTENNVCFFISFVQDKQSTKKRRLKLILLIIWRISSLQIIKLMTIWPWKHLYLPKEQHSITCFDSLMYHLTWYDTCSAVIITLWPRYYISAAPSFCHHKSNFQHRAIQCTLSLLVSSLM